MLGRPLAVVGLSRMVLLPAFTVTVSVLVTQVVQAPVPSNDGVWTVRAVDDQLRGPGGGGAVGEPDAQRRRARRRGRSR